MLSMPILTLRTEFSDRKFLALVCRVDFGYANATRDRGTVPPLRRWLMLKKQAANAHADPKKRSIRRVESLRRVAKACACTSSTPRPPPTPPGKHATLAHEWKGQSRAGFGLATSLIAFDKAPRRGSRHTHEPSPRDLAQSAGNLSKHTKYVGGSSSGNWFALTDSA